MKDISVSIDKKQMVELILALIVLVLASLVPSTSLPLYLTTIIFAVYAFFRPYQALVLLVPYVIFRTFFIEYSNGMKLVGDLITFIVLIRLFLMNLKDWKKWFTFKWFEWAFIAFIIFGSIIGVMSGVSVGAVVFQVRTFVIMYLLYYILSRVQVPRTFLPMLAWITIFSGAILFVQGIIEKISSRSMLMPEVWMQKVLSTTNAVRIYGLVNNPNTLALIMFFAICAAFYLQWLYNGEKHRIPLWISQIAFTGMLILTLSRGTWIVAIVFLIVFILLSRNWKLLLNVAITVAASVILIYLPTNWAVVGFSKIDLGGNSGEVITGGIGDRFKETIAEDNIDLMTESGRVFYIKKGFEVFFDHPITGTGFGSFGGSATLSYGSPIYEEYGIRSDIYGGKNFYSDNQYIQVIAETGAIGVVLFAAFLLFMLGMMWKERHTTFAKYLVGLWFATAAAGCFYTIWELKVYTMVIFLLLGIFAAQQSFYPKLSLDEEAERK
ncbi:MAG: O-antigen ligase family protein [Lysinibacillus sp.]